jgi:hypothetical protein
MKKRRTSQRERDERRRQWELDEKQRAETGAEIARLQKAGMSAGLIARRLNLGRLPPLAVRFLRSRLKHLPVGALFDISDKQAVIDLVKSNIMLDPATRRFIADELHRLYFPSTVRDRRAKKQAQNGVIESLMSDLRDRGMTVAEAKIAIVESAIGKELGIKTVGALERRLRPSRK